MWLFLCVVMAVSAKFLKVPPIEPDHSWAVAPRISTTSPFYSIADIHGEYTTLVSLLERSGIMRNGNWDAGDSVLVQLGDILDRGPHEVWVFRLFAHLRTQARAQGGEVVVLMGNHEWARIDEPELKLASLPLEVVIEHPDGNVLFSHAGPRVNHTDPDDLEGPLWNRAYAEGNCAELTQVLRSRMASTMVIGHTTQPIPTQMCGGRLWLSDTTFFKSPTILKFAESVTSYKLEL